MICPTCNGTGIIGTSQQVPCPPCNGTGHYDPQDP